MQCMKARYWKLLLAKSFRYILLTVIVGSACMCIVATIKESSLQGGLVTAIPPCTAFAAYAVAYFFPDRCATAVSSRDSHA